MAPRRLPRLWQQRTRGAFHLLGFWLAFFLAGFSAQAEMSVQVEQTGYIARFEAPTHRYGHGIMGDLPEWGRLCLKGPEAEACVELPQTRVFEDILPRLVDVDRDGALEAVVVESSITAGAALSIYFLDGGELRNVSTPPIGTRNRWLAPIGAADLDGDGHIELAYIDRPHLAKTLRIWRYRDGQLSEIARQTGLTNHRIGDPFISGGLRKCGPRPELITADASWQTVIASQFDGKELSTRILAPYNKANMRAALGCDLN